ncbi:MAG: heparinase II/III family protein [Alsobacter sp.]
MTQALGDRWRIAWLVTRHGLRGVASGLVQPLRLLTPRFGRGTPERLVIALQDLRTTDPTVANDIYAGYFTFAGKVVATGGVSPFQCPPPSRAWEEALSGFGWLRHLRAADSALARANARALVDDWITQQGRPRPTTAWEVPVAARRLLSWLSQSPLILEGADRAFYRRFLRSIARQAQWLEREAPRSRDGVARLSGVIALATTALCTGASVAAIRRASRLLAQELEAQILADGGHVTRNPQVPVDLLTDLLPLRQAYVTQGVEAPAALLNGIDRMMPMIRLFRHEDGALALFNGMSVTAPDIVATLLAYNDARAQPIENALHSGYQRLQARGSLVIVDTGLPPPQAYSDRAHAGCLSFEFSDGAQRIVVNCGAPPPGAEQWRQVARATAAHSTVTVADTSSCRFVAEGRAGGILGTPILAGPSEVTMQREVTREPDDPAIGLSASHDGYLAAFGVVHHRRLLLSTDGQRLTGRDRLEARSKPGKETDAYALRFHLHPGVRAKLEPDGRSVLLTLGFGRVWRFDAGGLPVALEESIFFATPDGARRSEQIVVQSGFRTVPDVDWSFERLA